MRSNFLEPSDFQTALDIQDACNLSGVVYAFSRVMEKICKESNVDGKGTDWKNSHAICVMFASKIASLTRCEDPLTLNRAMDECEKAAKGEAQ